MIAVITDVKTAPDQVGNALRGPHFGREAVSRGALCEKAMQLRQFRPGEFRRGARMLASDQSSGPGTPVSAPPHPDGLPTHTRSASDLRFRLAFANPLDGLAAALFQRRKIPLARLWGNHAPKSHTTGKISSYLCRGL